MIFKYFEFPLKKPSKHGYGLLGQKGFFDIFIVKFDLIKKEIDIKPRN